MSKQKTYRVTQSELWHREYLIPADSKQDALDKYEQMQRHDIEGLDKVMQGPYHVEDIDEVDAEHVREDTRPYHG